MIGRLAALILLCTVSLVQTAEVPHQISLSVVEVGENVTLQCPVSEKEEIYFNWYKQSVGFVVQTVARGVYDKIKLIGLFNNPRLKVYKVNDQYFLNISNVNKEDEATYFCQGGAEFSQVSIRGFFLAVNDRKQQKYFHVKQRPETVSVQPGDPVTFQCSLLSKNKEERVQCPGEHSVYWFRAGSEEFHPGVIYTHKNSSVEKVERSCVYSLSKTIGSSSDSGTYYCAVVTCGEILFGEGTKVETVPGKTEEPESDLLVLVLGVLLACCVTTVIVVLIFYIKRSRVCEHCKGAMSAPHRLGHDKSTADQSNDLDGEGKEVNYAALNFSTRKVKRGKKRESPQESVYSVVRTDYHNQQHPSL